MVDSVNCQLPALEQQSRKPLPFSAKEGNPKAKPSKTVPTEVPTSLPEQDLQASSSGQPPTSANLSKKKRSAQNVEPSRSRRLSATKPVAGKKRSHRSDTESTDDSTRPTEDEVPVHPKVYKEEEEETGSADIDSPPPPPPKPDTTRKKRRTEDTNPTRGLPKTSTRTKRSETPAVATRSVMRLRSGTRGLTTEPATRVFALWKQDGHYYSGVVHSRKLKNKYLVKFDDGTEDEVELKNMRYRELQVGDRVIVTQDNAKGVVSDVSHVDAQGCVTLEVDNGKAISTRQANFDDIRIANRTMQSQWKERTIIPENIVTLVRPKRLLDTTPSKQSVINTTSGKARRELAKTGFVVTINPKNEERKQTMDEAMRAIQRHGGEVVDDWARVFTMKGKHSQNNQRWIATPDDFHWKSEAKIDRVFLLSDDAHQKPKFLLALALGIPCLSFEWLTKEGEFSSVCFLRPLGCIVLNRAHVRIGNRTFFQRVTLIHLVQESLSSSTLTGEIVVNTLWTLWPTEFQSNFFRRRRCCVLAQSYFRAQ